MPAGSRLDNAVLSILAVCALVVTSMMVRREFLTPSDSAAPRPPTEIKDWGSYAVGNMRLGQPNAPIAITEFSDFECPYCGRLFHVLDEVLTKYPDDVQLIYRNFPLGRIHPNARLAALAAQCAAFQGRFREYYSLLFEHPDSLGKVPWTTLAARSGIEDKPAFDSCMKSDRAAARLRDDSLAAAALRISGTPTVMVNRWMLNEPPTHEALEKLIDKELAGIRTKRGN